MNQLELSYLEFYSGIGGWSFALQEAVDLLKKQNPNANFSLRRLAAFDHSDLCNHVLRYNDTSATATKEGIDVLDTRNNASEHRKQKKKKRKILQSVSIEMLTTKTLQEFNAMIWVMSPPCQPHTRQHSNQNEDINDPRSKSFLYLCEMISELGSEYLPKVILLENVLGFEHSKSCYKFRKALLDRNYKVNHFHLNPTQIGIPNDRPRHYSIAVLPIKESYIINSRIKNWFISNESLDSTVENDNVIIHKSLPDFEDATDHPITLVPLSKYLDSDNSHRNELLVPEKLIRSNSSWCFDIVTPKDARSACFTSSYGRFIRGTGSVIYTGSNQFEQLKLLPPEERRFDSEWSQGLDLVGNLRYFSGVEIGRLFGFPMDATVDGRSTFQFPPDCTERQQWKLLGNSINVHVAAKMAYIGLSVMLAGHEE